MLAISFDSYPVPGKSQIIRVSDLQPALVYTLSETYGGTYEVGASKTKLTGAAIQDMARKGMLHALRTYTVQGSKNGLSVILDQFSRRATKTLH